MTALVLLIISFVFLVLAAAGLTAPRLNLLATGLAFYVAAQLVARVL